MRGTINYKDGRKEYSLRVIDDAQKLMAFKAKCALDTVKNCTARVELPDGTMDICFKNFRVNITPEAPKPYVRPKNRIVKDKGRKYEIVILRD